MPIPNDISFKDIVSFLNRKGFIKTGGKSSHYVFTYDHNGIKEIVSITKPHPASQGVKPCYIQNVIDAIERIQSK